MVRNSASMQSLRSDLPVRSVEQPTPEQIERAVRAHFEQAPRLETRDQPQFVNAFDPPTVFYGASDASQPQMQSVEPQPRRIEQMRALMQQQQQVRRRMEERATHDGEHKGHFSEGAQKDYNMQLMLLEQQNKRRLMMARQEQEDYMRNNIEPALYDPYGVAQPEPAPTPMENVELHNDRQKFEDEPRNNEQRFRQATRENAAAYTKPFCDFLTENPTVFHAVDAMKKQLKDEGFTQISERDSWKIERSGKYFVERNGSSLIAFVVGANYEPGNGTAILAGHIDALTAKLKPVSQVPNKAGYLQLGVAPYAGGLGRTWWDRDLGIGGRVHIKEGDKIVTKLVKLDWPIAKIPSLAEHFGAVAAEPFINPNKETRMVPIMGLDTAEERSIAPLGPVDPFARPTLLHSKDGIKTFVSTQPPALVKAIGTALGLRSNETHNIVQWELELFDVQPATVIGLSKEMISAGRIDDKLCSWAALQALIESSASDTKTSSLIKVAFLSDDEEIGSQLRQGAKSNFLQIVLERAVGAMSGHTLGSDIMGRTYANSFMVSSDVSHAVNPNFTEVYLANHAPRLNVGVAIAADSNGHMTTDSVSTTILKRCADKVGAQLQVFQIRNDSRSGGTVGPMLSSALGMRCIDAGLPQLSMHSIRATTGALDPGLGVLMFAGFLNGFEEVDKEFTGSN